MKKAAPLEGQLVRKGFNRCATSYDNAAVLSKVVAEHLLDRLSFIKLNPETILDLGAGTGVLTRQLKARYPSANVIAVDVAEKALALNSNGVCSDVVKLPFKNNSVALCCLNLVLPWVTDRVAVFQEVKRVLKPQGLLMFSTLGPDTLCELKAIFPEGVHDFVDMHDVGDELLSVKFQDPVMDRQTLSLAYPDFKTLRRDLKQSGSQNIRGDRNPAYLGKTDYQAIVTTFEGKQIDGHTMVTAEVLFGHAWRPPLQADQTVNEAGEVSIPISVLKS